MVLELWGGHAVMHEQGVQGRAEHTALTVTGVDSQGGGCGAANSHSLGALCQEAEDPVTEGGFESQVSELGDVLERHNGIEC